MPVSKNSENISPKSSNVQSAHLWGSEPASKIVKNTAQTTLTSSASFAVQSPCGFVTAILITVIRVTERPAVIKSTPAKAKASVIWGLGLKTTYPMGRSMRSDAMSVAVISG